MNSKYVSIYIYTGSHLVRTMYVYSNTCMYTLYDNTPSFSVCLQRTLVALCRDLTGVARSFTSKTSYMMLFDWVYPTDSVIYRDCTQQPITAVLLAIVDGG